MKPTDDKPTCRGCGKEFVRNKAGQRFCSRACSKEALFRGVTHRPRGEGKS